MSMQLTLSAVLAALPGARLHGVADAALTFSDVATDSRHLSGHEIFVALKGERFDAHDFLRQVAEQGVKVAIVARYQPQYRITQIEVVDTLRALGDLAQYWRRRFDLPVIAVTGSNGKTTVKEMLAAILEQAVGPDAMLATRGNFNNEIGVPLTVFRLRETHQLAVLELGMNHPGEIARLAEIAQPTVALVNNAQREHQEFMATVAAVAEENGAVLKALPADGIAIYPAQDEFTSVWQKLAGHRQSYTFSLTQPATVYATHVVLTVEGQSRFNLVCAQGTNTVLLNTLGEHNIRNALAAAACALAAGISLQTIVAGLESFAPVKGRLQRYALSGRVLIDDTYNANPDSVKAAIDVLATTAQPRCLILGDMGEVGEQGESFHAEVGAYAQANGIESLICVGDLARFAAQAYGVQAQSYPHVEALQQALNETILSARSILVKGSRFMKMERVVATLKAMYADSPTDNETIQ